MNLSKKEFEKIDSEELDILLVSIFGGCSGNSINVSEPSGTMKEFTRVYGNKKVYVIYKTYTNSKNYQTISNYNASI